MAQSALDLGIAHHALVSPAGRIVRANERGRARPDRRAASTGLAGGHCGGGRGVGVEPSRRVTVVGRRLAWGRHGVPGCARCQPPPAGAAPGIDAFPCARASAGGPHPLDWLHAIGPALLLLGLHYVWVIRSDTAFEEAAAETSLRRARARGRRGARPAGYSAHRRLPALLRLAPLGWPAGAILWKNVLAVVRARRTRATAGVFLAAAGGAAILC